MSTLHSAEFASLYPDRSLPIPVARQFTDNLRAAITSGHLVEGTRLLPSREFAARIGVSRNTIVAAIEQLIAEGYLMARVGSGTFVAPLKPQRYEIASDPFPELPASAIRFLDAVAPYATRYGNAPLFRQGIPDVRAFPAAAWDRCSRRNDYRARGLRYGPSAGMMELREALAQHLCQFRGIVARADDIIITEGAQSALTLIAEVMTAPGDPVVFEDPCYGMGHATFVARGVRTIAIAVDENGLDATTAPAARLACVTPSHQYPRGGVMGERRRAALVAWARSNDAYIVEDDYDGEFTFSRTPLPALQGEEPQRVLYVGTFSKVLAPGLRLGYLVSPPHLTSAFSAARALSSLGSPAATQLTMSAFIRDGHLARHARQLTGVYRGRAERLAELLAPLSDLFTVGPITGGLHLAITARRSIDDVGLARLAGANGISLHPLSVECIDRSDLTGFVLGLGMSPVEALPGAVDALVGIVRAEAPRYVRPRESTARV